MCCSMEWSLVPTYFSVDSRGADALLVQQGVYNLQQGTIPNNQWTLEVRRLDTSLVQNIPLTSLSRSRVGLQRP